MLPLVFAWALYLIAQVADILTTRRALLFQGTSEGNPVIAYLMRALGPRWWIAKVAIAFGAVLLMSIDRRADLIVLTALITGGVALMNYRIILKRGGW